MQSKTVQCFFRYEKFLSLNRITDKCLKIGFRQLSVQVKNRFLNVPFCSQYCYNLLYTIKKNRLYLIAVFSILVYCVLFSIFIVLLFDPKEKILSVDKLLHFGVFSVLSYFLYFLFSYQEKIWFIKKHRTNLTLIIACSIGVGIEFLQLLTPAYSTSVNDMFANLCGAIFTVLVIKYLPKKIKKLRKVSI